jgi:DNA-directed RNA polymerase sigma subunit (sigma70/sigma32)
MSQRADKIRETLSATNRQVIAALTRDIFDAFESGQTIKQLCQEYGLPEERVRDILKDEKARWSYRR